MKIIAYGNTEEINYLEENFGFDNFFTEDQSIKIHWSNRILKRVIDFLHKDCELLLMRPESLACSTSQILEIFNIVITNGAYLRFEHPNCVVSREMKILDLLSLLSLIESNFVSKRTKESLGRRKAAGLLLGRPKGRKNKSLKLDKFENDILRYLELGVSRASIAKLIACHPQTLYDWIERKGIIHDRS